MTAIASTAIALLAAASPGSACAPKKLVESFYTQALIKKQVRPAFEHFVSPEFVEHKPDIASSDREGAVIFLESLIKELPSARWELLRIIGDGDLVAVHARFVPTDGAPAYAIADFFRVEECAIREHWDIVAAPRENMPNPLSPF